jgi:hypothetical protein
MQPLTAEARAVIDRANADGFALTDRGDDPVLWNRFLRKAATDRGVPIIILRGPSCWVVVSARQR